MDKMFDSATRLFKAGCYCIFTLASSIAAADDLLGRELVEACNVVSLHGNVSSRERALQGGRCLGYLTGFKEGVFVNTAVLKHSYGKDVPNIFCISDSRGSAGDLADVVIRYSEIHPEALDRPGFVLALKAFEYEFPCTK